MPADIPSEITADSGLSFDEMEAHSPHSGKSASRPNEERDSQFEPIKWSELAGWTADDHLAAYTTYQTSCQALPKSRRSDFHM